MKCEDMKDPFSPILSRVCPKLVGPPIFRLHVLTLTPFINPGLSTPPRHHTYRQARPTPLSHSHVLAISYRAFPTALHRLSIQPSHHPLLTYLTQSQATTMQCKPVPATYMQEKPVLATPMQYMPVPATLMQYKPAPAFAFHIPGLQRLPPTEALLPLRGNWIRRAQPYPVICHRLSAVPHSLLLRPMHLHTPPLQTAPHPPHTARVTPPEPHQVMPLAPLQRPTRQHKLLALHMPHCPIRSLRLPQGPPSFLHPWDCPAPPSLPRTVWAQP